MKGAPHHLMTHGNMVASHFSATDGEPGEDKHCTWRNTAREVAYLPLTCLQEGAAPQVLGSLTPAPGERKPGKKYT